MKYGQCFVLFMALSSATVSVMASSTTQRLASPRDDNTPITLEVGGDKPDHLHRKLPFNYVRKFYRQNSVKTKVNRHHQPSPTWKKYRRHRNRKYDTKDSKSAKAAKAGKGLKGFYPSGILKMGVASFVLVDAEKNSRIWEIQNGAVISAEDLLNEFGASEIAFECLTFGNVGSVVFSSSNGFDSIDSRKPFTLFGGFGGDYLGIPLESSAGPWTLSCQPFTGLHAGGNGGPVAEIQFSISSLGSIPTLVPSFSVAPSSSAQPTARSNAPTASPSATSVEPSQAPSTQSPTSETSAPSTHSPTTDTSTPTLSPTTITDTPTLNPTDTPTGAPSPEGTSVQAVTYGLQPDCNVIDETRFNICLDISSESGQVEDWFSTVIEAKEVWESIIVGDLWGPWSVSDLANQPEEYIATELPDEPVDDMYVAIIIRPIQGSSLAIAGPDLADTFRPRPYPIRTGSIIIDPDDLVTAQQNNIFLDLIIHEFGHVFGFGNLFEEDDQISGGIYVGDRGLQAWRAMGCDGDLPLGSTEDTGHWNENCLDREIMTPTLQFNREQFFSNLTMSAMEDIGYTVNRDLMEPYTIDNLDECGDFCDTSQGQRYLRSPQSGTAPKPEVGSSLSREGEQEILQTAADHFRKKSQYQNQHRGSQNDRLPLQHQHSIGVSILYHENGQYFSRTVREEQVAHLL